jgi:hypothetical protein
MFFPSVVAFDARLGDRLSSGAFRGFVPCYGLALWFQFALSLCTTPYCLAVYSEPLCHHRRHTLSLVVPLGQHNAMHAIVKEQEGSHLPC